MTPEIRQQVLDKQRETHAQKLEFQQQLHRKRKVLQICPSMYFRVSAQT